LSPLHRPLLHKVLHAPRTGEVVVLPGIVHTQERQMIALVLVEAGLALIRLLGPLLRPIIDILHGQHGHDGEHLVRTPQMTRHDQRLGQLRLQRELGHPSAQLGQKTLVVQGAQRVQALHRHNQRLHRWRIHEVKGQQIIDAHGLERGIIKLHINI